MLKKIFIVISILVSLFILFMCNGWHIEFNEDRIMSGNIEYGESFNLFKGDARLKGKFICKEKGLPLFSDIEHNVNKKELGSYEIIYSADFLFWNNTMKTTLNIVDTTPPELTLNTIKYNYTSPCELYEEEGYKAYDRYDGDITDKVTSYFKDGKMYYSVTDSSGNTSNAVREIAYKDSSAPRIYLSGETLMNIRQHEEYVEPGFTATDDCDGDLTASVIVENNVNIHVPGRYEILYKVVDSWENDFTAIRTVIVNEIIEPANPIIPEETTPEETLPPEDESTSTEETPPVEVVVPEEKSNTEEQPPVVQEEKVIYLTFDDGPSKYTKDLLKILKDNDVKATFFVVGSKYSDTISDIYADGHAIGIHSFTHTYKEIYSSVDAYFEDLNKIRDLIYDKTGYYTNLVRFPGGSSNTVSNFNKGIMTTLASELESRGYAYFDWNVSSGDAGGESTTNGVYNNVIKGIGNKKTAIVLQHDTKKFSIDAVQDIITWGKENGYTFMPLNINSPTSHHKIYN